jgi:hypothetical protein
LVHRILGQDVNLAVVDEIAAPNMLLKCSLHEPRRGRSDIKAFMTDFRAAFPDLNFWGTADLIAEGDYVVGQWEGGGTHTGPAFKDFLTPVLPEATLVGQLSALLRRSRPTAPDPERALKIAPRHKVAALRRRSAKSDQRWPFAVARADQKSDSDLKLRSGRRTGFVGIFQEWRGGVESLQWRSSTAANHGREVEIF